MCSSYQHSILCEPIYQQGIEFVSRSVASRIKRNLELKKHQRTGFRVKKMDCHASLFIGNINL